LPHGGEKFRLLDLPHYIMGGHGLVSTGRRSDRAWAAVNAPMALREENVLRQAETGGEPAQSDRRQPGQQPSSPTSVGIDAEQVDFGEPHRNPAASK
jgi:hypothetical protein